MAGDDPKETPRLTKQLSQAEQLRLTVRRGDLRCAAFSRRSARLSGWARTSEISAVNENLPIVNATGAD